MRRNTQSLCSCVTTDNDDNQELDVYKSSFTYVGNIEFHYNALNEFMMGLFSSDMAPTRPCVSGKAPGSFK